MSIKSSAFRRRFRTKRQRILPTLRNEAYKRSNRQHWEKEELMKKRSLLTTACALVLSAVLIPGCAVAPAQEQQAQPAAAVEGEAAPEEPAVEAEAPVDPAIAASGSPWIDGSASEALTEGMELSPRDNFYLYVNYDYLMRRKNGEKDPNESHEKMLQEVKGILEDSHAENHCVELSQDFYKAYVDVDARNKDGVEPLRPVIEDICSISSMDEMTAFLTDADRSINVPLMARLMKISDSSKPDEYSGAIYFRSFVELSLGDSDEYPDRSEEGEETYRDNKERTVRDLTQLGFSEKEAAQAYEDFIAAETVLASGLDSFMEVMTETGRNKFEYISVSDLSEIMGDYPMADIMESRGYDPEGTYTIENRDYLHLIGEFYKEENLELIKNYHMVGFLLKYEGICGVPDPKETEDFESVFTRVNYYLADILSDAYLSRYDRSKDRQILMDFAGELKDVYASIIREEDWMSEETKEKAVAKLMDLELILLYGDHPVDYSSVDLSGKSLAEMVMTLDAFRMKRDASLVGKKIIPDQHAFTWMPTLEDNARAFPEVNALLFTVGIVDGYGDVSKMSTEELYATIGYVLGHEMSHCFDENGSKIDINGVETDWWKEEERAAFEARVQKVVDYFNGISVFEGVNCDGRILSAEATADITSIQAILKLAKQHEDFDYDAFFRYYAKQYAYYSNYKWELHILGDDPHPLAYLRTNVVLQQFDEFNETYGVQEGDAMYLAPEDRILVW